MQTNSGLQIVSATNRKNGLSPIFLYNDAAGKLSVPGAIPVMLPERREGKPSLVDGKIEAESSH
jgi:hypothetical protein